MRKGLKIYLTLAAVGLLMIAASQTPFARSMVKRLEGLSLTPYQDDAGIWTIGYGHRIVVGDPYWSPNNPKGTLREITLEQAEAQLTADLNKARNAVIRFTGVPLSQSQIDALTSFVYNVGSGNFSTSTLLKKINAGDFTGAADEFKRWIYVTKDGKKVVNDGLIARRAQEANVFVS